MTKETSTAMEGGGPPPPKRKVLFIASQPYFQWRGSPIRLGFDVQALAELGYDVDFLTLPIGEDKPVPGVNVIRVRNWFGIKNIPIGPSFWKAVFDLFLLFKGFGLAIKNRYDVVHGVEDAGTVAWLIKSATPAKLVFEKHSDPSSYKKGLVMWLYAKVEAFTIRRADAVIGTGPGLVKQANEISPDTTAYQISDIPSSLVQAEGEKVGKIRSKLQAHPEELLVTYVGSFAVYQGIDLMFQSMPRVIRQHEAARFVIIGGTSQEIEERRNWLSKQGVDGAVSFIGKIPPDELPNYLAASDILLSPRIAGTNTPLKLLDYLKAGGAIVATDNEANRLILDDDNAMLVEPNAETYAEGILRVLEGGELRGRLSAKGKELIRTTYNFDEFKRRIGECYDGLTS